MSQKTTIEWTESTWNPVTGCTKVSPGCTNCYAATFAERFRGVKGHPYEQGFDLKLWPERLEIPLRWKRPRKIFVNSMSDLFHSSVPDQFIEQVFDVMIQADWHQFQVLTKRSDRMMEWTNSYCNRKGLTSLLDNIWLGVSVENQNYVFRISHLQRTAASICFLSIEPLLGPIQLDKSNLENVHQVIVGGESGPHSRRMDPQWVRDIRDACQMYNVPFFFKQWGAYDPNGKHVGKKKSGRVLDGIEWNEFPIKINQVTSSVVNNSLVNQEQIKTK